MSASHYPSHSPHPQPLRPRSQPLPFLSRGAPAQAFAAHYDSVHSPEYSLPHQSQPPQGAGPIRQSPSSQPQQPQQQPQPPGGYAFQQAREVSCSPPPPQQQQQQYNGGDQQPRGQPQQQQPQQQPQQQQQQPPPQQQQQQQQWEQQWGQQWEQQQGPSGPPPRFATVFSSAAEELQAKSETVRELAAIAAEELQAKSETTRELGAMDDTCSGATESP